MTAPFNLRADEQAHLRSLALIILGTFGSWAAFNLRADEQAHLRSLALITS